MSFTQCVLPVIPLRGCDWCYDDQSLHWMPSRASSLLCVCHSPVGGRVCSPHVGVEAHRSVCELWCEVGRWITEYSSTGSIHRELHPMVSSTTHRAGSQRLLLFVVASALPQQRECKPSGTVFTKPAGQISRQRPTAFRYQNAVVTAPLWEQRKQPRTRPGFSVSTHTHKEHSC